jgi:armadillo repeat-containing protein 8
LLKVPAFFNHILVFSISFFFLQVNLVLDSNHPAEVKEQALCILGNIGAGARDRDYILEDESLLVKLLDFLVSFEVHLKYHTQPSVFHMENFIFLRFVS